MYNPKTENMTIETASRTQSPETVPSPARQLFAQMVPTIDTLGFEELDRPLGHNSIFDFQDDLESRIAQATGEPYGPRGEISSEYMHARKEFLFGVFDYFNQAAEQVASPDDDARLVNLAAKTEQLLFSYSPNFTDYIGYDDDVLEAIQKADACSYFQRAQWELTEGLMQNITFARDPQATIDILSKKLADAQPASQLQYLRLLNRLASNAVAASYGEQAADILLQTIDHSTQNSNALVSLTAATIADRVAVSISSEMPAPNPGQAIAEQALYGYTPQVDLPVRYKDRFLISPIAKDVIGVFNSYGGLEFAAAGDLAVPGQEQLLLGKIQDTLDRYSHQGNVQTDVLGYCHDQLAAHGLSDAADALATAPIGQQNTALASHVYSGDKVAIQPEPISEFLPPTPSRSDTMLLLAEMHHPAVKEILQTHLGIQLHELTLPAQTQLLEHLSHKQLADFNRLCNAGQRINDADRVTFYETFLTTQLGEDFGDALVGIAEYADPAECIELLSVVAQSGDQIKIMASAFPKEVQTEVQHALNERFTEILYVAKAVAQHGSVDEKVFDRLPIKVADLPELTEDITTLLNAFDAIGDIWQNGYATEVTKHTTDTSQLGFAAYRLHGPNGRQALLYTRSEGAARYNPHYEFGRPQEGVEASIGFIIDPITHAYVSATKKDRALSELSIRLDREGLSPVSNRDNKTDRDPTRPQGTISLDIGSILGKDQSFGTRIGRIIAVGNMLRAGETGRSVELNHNAAAFNQGLHGTSDGFARLAAAAEVQAIDRLILSEDKKQQRLATVVGRTALIIKPTGHGQRYAKPTQAIAA